MSWKPSEEIVARALVHAEQSKPAESCAVVVDGKYIEITNRATDKDNFAMDRKEFLAACKLGKLEAVVHSHVYAPPIASQGDLTMCEMTNVPWLIINWPVGNWNVIEPSGFVAPLIGRQWCFGALDCWSLARDGFQAFTGKTIPDFPREWEWWRHGENLIVENVKNAGFINLGGEVMPRHCDMIVMQIRSEVPNHIAIYLEPDGIILHHLQGHLSVRETYGGFFQKATRFIARHKDFMAQMPPLHDPNDRSIWTGEVVGREYT